MGPETFRRGTALALVLLAGCAAPRIDRPAVESTVTEARAGSRIVELIVLPVAVVDIPTRRASTSFTFEILEASGDVSLLPTIAAGAGELASQLAFRLYLGSDRQQGVDSIGRLTSLLEAEPVRERDAAFRLERPNTIGWTGPLLVTYLERAPARESLWIFERGDGERVALQRVLTPNGSTRWAATATAP